MRSVSEQTVFCDSYSQYFRQKFQIDAWHVFPSCQVMAGSHRKHHEAFQLGLIFHKMTIADMEMSCRLSCIHDFSFIHNFPSLNIVVKDI